MLASEEQLEAVDEFIADENKTLDGGHPIWISGQRGNEQYAEWPVKDGNWATRGALRFRVSTNKPDWPSISLVFRGRPISRLDRVPDVECHDNLPGARKLGLPPLVCGPHIHTWTDNREYIKKSGVWDLPYRRHAPVHMKDLTHMFHWFLGEVRINIAPDQKGFQGPERQLV